MIPNQILLNYASGHGTRVYRPSGTLILMALLTGFTGMVRDEVGGCPRGAIPFLWRVFFPHAEKMQFGWTLRTPIRSDGRVSYRSIMSEKKLVQMFWKRMGIIAGVCLILTGVPLFLFPLTDRVWNGTQPNAAVATAWTPNGIPGAADTAIFNSTSSNDCAWDVPGVITAVQIGQVLSAYPGTITLSTAMNTSADLAYFASSGATVAIVAQTLTIGGDFFMTAGNLITVTTGTLDVGNELDLTNGNITVSGAATITAVTTTLTAGTFTGADATLNLGDVLVQGATLTFTGSVGVLNVTSFAQTSGTTTASATTSDIQCGGDWLVSGGTWTDNRGLLTLTGSGNLEHSSGGRMRLTHSGVTTTSLVGSVFLIVAHVHTANTIINGTGTITLATGSIASFVFPAGASHGSGVTFQIVASSSGTFSVGGSFNNLILRASADTLTLATALTCVGNLTLSNLTTTVILDAATFPVSVTGTTTIESDGTLDLGTSAGHTFTGDVTIPGTLTGGSATAIFSGNLNMTGGVFTQNTSTIDMSGGTGTLTCDPGTEVFYNLTTGSNTLTTPGFSASVQVLNTFSNSGTTTIASTNLQIVGATPLTNFTSNALINSGSTSSLTFRTQGASATLDNIGSITNINVQFEGISGSSNTITLGSALILTTAGTLLIRNNGGTNTILDAATFGITAASTTTVNSGAELDWGSGTHTFTGNVTITGTLTGGTGDATCGGNWDTSAATFTSGTSTVAFTGSPTITTNGALSGAFYILEWAANSTTTTIAVDIYITNYVDFLGDGDISGASDVFLTSPTQPDQWRNSSAANDFTAWSGAVIYDPTGVAAAYNIGGYYPDLTVTTNAAGAGTATIVDPIFANAIIMGDTFASSAFVVLHDGTQPDDITADSVFVAELTTWRHPAAATVSTTVIISGTITVEGEMEFIAGATVPWAISCAAMTVTSNGPGSGVLELTGKTSTGAILSILGGGGPGTGRLTCNADTVIQINGVDAFNPLTVTVGSIFVNLADIFELEFLLIGSSISADPTLRFDGNYSAVTSIFVRSCDIIKSGGGTPALEFNGATWNMGAGEITTFQNLEITDINIDGAHKIWIQDSTVVTPADCILDPGGSSIVVYGTTQGAPDDTADLYGILSAPSQMHQSIETGSRDFVVLRDSADGDTILTVVGDQDFDSFVMEADTNLIVNTTITMTTIGATNLAQTTVFGTLDLQQSGGTVNIIETITADGTGGPGLIQIAPGTVTSVVISDTARIDVTNNGRLVFDGGAKATRIALTRAAVVSTAPSIRIINAPDGGTIGVQLSFCTIDDFGSSGGDAAIDETSATGASRVLIEDCIFNNCAGDAISIAFASSRWEIVECIIDTPGTAGIRIDNTSLYTDIHDVLITDAADGIVITGSTFAGKIRRCRTLGSTAAGLRLEASIVPGAIRNSTFIGATNDINVIGPSIAQIIHCMLDSTKPLTAQVSAGSGAWNVISMNHNRENTKQVIIYNDLIIDSAFEKTTIHEDDFGWSNFIISPFGDELQVPTPAVIPISDGIVVQQSQTYYVAWTGTLTQASIIETVTGGGTNTYGPFATGFTQASAADAQSWQIEFTAAVADETTSHVEVRETNSAGALIFNEDLINKPIPPSAEWIYDTNELRADADTTQPFIYGNTGVESPEVEIDITDTGTDEIGGHVIAYQDPLNHYEVFIVDNAVASTYPSGSSVVITKLIAGTRFVIDHANTVDGSPLPALSGQVKLRVTRNQVASRAFEVFIDDEQVLVGDWTNESVNDYVTDTTFAIGKLGLLSGVNPEESTSPTGDGPTLDNLFVTHPGFYIRDANLNIEPTAIIQVKDGGVFDLRDVVVNASRGILQEFPGSTIIENNVTWLLGDPFDPQIDGSVSYVCVNLVVPAGEDIILGPGGCLNLDGVIIRSGDESDLTYYRIITDFSLAVPPITVGKVILQNVITRFRTLDNSEPPYELTPPELADYSVSRPKIEMIDEGEFDEHPVNVISQEAYGRDSNFNVVKSHGDHTINITFRTEFDLCLYAFLQRMMDNETLLEVISPRGILTPVMVVDLIGIPQDNANMDDIVFTATFQEFS